MAISDYPSFSKTRSSVSGKSDTANTPVSKPGTSIQKASVRFKLASENGHCITSGLLPILCAAWMGVFLPIAIRAWPPGGLRPALALVITVAVTFGPLVWVRLAYPDQIARRTEQL